MKKLPQINHNLRKANRGAISEMVAVYLEELDAGELDPLDTFIFSHKLLEFATMLNNAVRPHIRGIKGEFYGLRISEVKTGSTFDYSGCGSHKLPYLLGELERFKEMIAQEQAMLKSLPHSMQIVDEDTGECYELKPPANHYTISPKIEWL